MMVQGWRNLALGAVGVLVLGTGVYWWEYSARPKREEAEAESKKLFALKNKPIQSIDVSYRPTQRRVALQCVDPDSKKCALDQQGAWNVTEPVKAKGDASNANALVTSLGGLTVSETLHLDEETAEKRGQLLKDYELDAATRVNGSKVTLKFQDGSQQTLFLGAVHPNGDKQYALMAASQQQDLSDPSTVVMIPSYFKAQLDRDLTYWRDKKIVTFTVFEAEKFSLKSSKGELSGEKKNGHWKISPAGSSEGFAGDFENIESLLSAMTGLQATQFSEANVLASARQELSLDVTTQDQKRYRVRLFEDAKSKKLYVTAEHAQAEPGAVYEVAAFVKERLAKSAKDLRLAKLLTSVERYSVKAMEFNAGTQQLVFENKDAKWTVKANGKVDDALSPKASELLDALSGNRIKEFLADSQLSAEAKSARKKSLRVRIQGESSNLQKEFEFWKTEKPAAVFAVDLASPRKNEVYRVDDALANQLPWGGAFASPKQP